MGRRTKGGSAGGFAILLGPDPERIGSAFKSEKKTPGRPKSSFLNINMIESTLSEAKDFQSRRAKHGADG